MTHPHWIAKQRKRRALVERGGYECFYCKGPIAARTGRANSATRDHVVPRSRGGGNGRDNIVVACWRCNQVKGNMTGDEFRELYPDPEALPVLPHPKKDKPERRGVTPPVRGGG